MLSPLLIVNLVLMSKRAADVASSFVSSLPIHWAPSQALISPFMRPVENVAASDTDLAPRLSTTVTRHQ
jgi:hypothetical protein